jgi:hypothetical protein
MKLLPREDGLKYCSLVKELAENDHDQLNNKITQEWGIPVGQKLL